MAGTQRPQGGGHPGDMVAGGPNDHVRARAPRDVREELLRRAAAETGGNRSRFIVRCLDWALFSEHRMPPNWTLDEERSRPAS